MKAKKITIQQTLPWECYMHESYKTPYYYNANTRETTWARPQKGGSRADEKVKAICSKLEALDKPKDDSKIEYRPLHKMLRNLPPPVPAKNSQPPPPLAKSVPSLPQTIPPNAFPEGASSLPPTTPPTSFPSKTLPRLLPKQDQTSPSPSASKQTSSIPAAQPVPKSRRKSQPLPGAASTEEPTPAYANLPLKSLPLPTIGPKPSAALASNTGQTTPKPTLGQSTSAPPKFPKPSKRPPVSTKPAVYTFPELSTRSLLTLKEGSSRKLKFTSNPPADQHLIGREKGTKINKHRVYIKDGCVHFCNITRNDSGKYYAKPNKGTNSKWTLFIQLIVKYPPTYSLDPDYLQVTAGSSPTMEFTVTSYPPLVDAKHTLSKKVYGGTTTGKRFKVEGNKIVLRNVDVGDSGLYRISCCNDDGEEGEEILELEVRPSDDAPQAVRKTSITSLQSQAQSDKQVTSASTSKRYLGKTAPDMRDLSILRNPSGGPPFHLLQKIGENWQLIGDALGLEDSFLKAWACARDEPDWRIRKILRKWMENASQLEGGYAYTWDGLRNLLEDAGYAQVAKSYFEMLEKSS